MSGYVDGPEERKRRVASRTAAVWYAVPVAALLVNAYVVPWNSTSCDDEPGFCVTRHDLMGILVMVTVPFLIVSLAVALGLAGRLARRFVSPVAAGTVAALCGFTVTAGAALLLYAGHRVDLY